MVFEEPLPEALNCNPPRPIMKVLSLKVPEAPYGYTIMGVDRPLPYWTQPAHEPEALNLKLSTLPKPDHNPTLEIIQGLCWGLRDPILEVPFQN